MILKAVSMMKLKAVLSFLLCIALFAGLLVLPAGAAVSAVTITFFTEGGSAVAPITQDVGTEVIPPPDPTKEDYFFIGWEPPLPAIMPADDIICFAQWEENPGIGPSMIYFDSNGGTPVDPIVVDPDAIMICPPDPTREGYAFMGWEPPIPAIMLEYNMTCVAQWELYTFTSTITIVTDGGTPVAPITLEVGTEVTPPADPVKAGYIFTGWSPAIPAIMPEDDVTCVAQWRLLGDLDNNGSITSVDALIALQGSTGEYLLSALQRLAADANHDGRISSMDALMLLHAASGLITL